MENKINEIPNYQILSEKLYEVMKGENYDDVENAVRSLMQSLKRKSVVK